MNEIVSTHGYSQNQVVVWKYPTMTKLATLTGRRISMFGYSTALSYSIALWILLCAGTIQCTDWDDDQDQEQDSSVTMHMSRDLQTHKPAQSTCSHTEPFLESR